MLRRVMPDSDPAEEHTRCSDEMDVRLSELEMRSEFQARTMEDLDTVVREFAERVARLEEELRELRSQLEAFNDGDGEAPAVDPVAS